MADKLPRLQASKVAHVRDKIESGQELSPQETALVGFALTDYLHDRESANAILEFHKWIKRGDKILTDMLSELDQLRTVTDPEGDNISKSALFDLLDKYYNARPKNEVDTSVNWLIDTIKKQVDTHLIKS